jgi:hypothetical protein
MEIDVALDRERNNETQNDAAGNNDTNVHPTRRTVVTKTAKLLVYSAPLIQLFRPSQALAASGVSPTS